MFLPPRPRSADAGGSVLRFLPIDGRVTTASVFAGRMRSFVRGLLFEAGYTVV